MAKSLSVNTVLSLFFDMTGEDKVEDWMDFCRASCKTIESSLKNGIDVEANHSLLCNAAACHALYIYVLRSCATNIADFKTVDVSIVSANSLTLNSAKMLLEDALASVSHLMRSTRFAFRTI